MGRRTRGIETWTRLQQWTQGAAIAERLAAQLLRAEGFTSIDPSHPLGGPDGLKDVVCERRSQRWLAGAYFPRGQKTFAAILKKLKHDIRSIGEDRETGFIFVTNQELRLSERKKLAKITGPGPCEIYHLERVSSILDSPSLYGVRLEFLDIEMTREEQLAFFAELQRTFNEFAVLSKSLIQEMKESGVLDQKLKSGVPLTELREFSMLLNQLSGYSGSVLIPTIHNLRVPLAELREFSMLLNQISGYSGAVLMPTIHNLKVPLAELREFSMLLNQISGYSGAVLIPTIHNLKVPLAELREFSMLLNQITGPSGALLIPAIHNLNVLLPELREFVQLLGDTVLKSKELGALSQTLTGHPIGSPTSNT